MAQTLHSLVQATADTLWVFPLVALVTAIDGIWPPIPSEYLIVGLAALSAAGTGPNLAGLAIAAAVGAFIGDLTAYSVGRALGMHGLAKIKNKTLQRGLQAMAGALQQHGTPILFVGRFLPVGRVAINMLAGATNFPRRTFSGIVALTASCWACYAVTLGVLGGRWAHENPFIAILLSVAIAFILGLGVERMLRRSRRVIDLRPYDQSAVAVETARTDRVIDVTDSRHATIPTGSTAPRSGAPVSEDQAAAS